MNLSFIKKMYVNGILLRNILSLNKGFDDYSPIGH